MRQTTKVLGVAILWALSNPLGVVAQQPSDLEVVTEVLLALGDTYDRDAQPEKPLAANRVFINPTVRRHASEGTRLDTLSFARPGNILPSLPLNARPAPGDCNVQQSLAGCGIKVGELLVIVGNGRATGDDWVVDVHVLTLLNERGYVGGAHYIALFQQQSGKWRVLEFTLSGVL